MTERLLDWLWHQSHSIATTSYTNPNGITSYVPSASTLKEQKPELARMHVTETKPIESAKEPVNNNINNKDAKISTSSQAVLKQNS